MVLIDKKNPVEWDIIWFNDKQINNRIVTQVGNGDDKCQGTKALNHYFTCWDFYFHTNHPSLISLALLAPSHSELWGLCLKTIYFMLYDAYASIKQ